MDTESVFNNGGVIVKNPAYSKRAKKNKQPEFVKSDNSANQNGLADSFFDANPENSYTFENPTKYSKYGVVPTRRVANIDAELANAQSNWSKIGNSIAQTIVSQVGIGIPLGISNIADAVGQAVGISDHNYSNPLSKTLANWQNTFDNEVAPINVTPGVDISNGGLVNLGWWAKNIPSVASSLTLLIPSIGIVKGLSYLGKIAKLGSMTRTAIRAASALTKSEKIMEFANLPENIARANKFLEMGATASLSRTMENYQEARGVYEDMYNDASVKIGTMDDEQYNNLINTNQELLKGVDTSNRDEVAKAISRKSADEDFRDNYVNTVFDVIQLYALKDIFGSGKLSSIGRVAARKAQRESIKYAGMADDAIAAAKQSEKFITKAGNVIGDRLLGAKYATAAQLSEGVEEAINYISQEEGMHTGRTILGEEQPNAFDTRLKSYMQAPQLWESAFWGTIGGIVFQYAGGKFKQIENSLLDKSKDKKNNKDNNSTETTTKDDTNGILGWKGLSQLPEVQRRVKNINNRQAKLNSYKEDIKRINDGINIYAERNDAKDTKIGSQADKDAILNKRRNEYITDLAMSSLNNGNFELTKEYLGDENVRQAMVNAGITTDAESKQFQQETIQKMDEVKTRYKKNIVHLSNIAADITSKGDYKGIIPIEYLQMAATQNVYNQIDIDALEKQSQGYLNKFIEAKNNAGDKLDPNIDYEGAIRLQATTWSLMDLYIARNEIKKNMIKNPKLSDQIALENVENQIKILHDTIGETTKNDGYEMLYAIAHISDKLKALGQTSEDADLSKLHLDEAAKLDSAISDIFDNKNFTSINRILGRNYEQVNDVDFEAFKGRMAAINDNFKNALTGDKAISNLGSDIASSYINYSQLQNTKNIKQSQLINDKQGFTDFITMVHNTTNEMRKNAINQATNDIISLTEKYDTIKLNNLIYDHATDTNTYNENKKDLDQEDADKLDNALKVLNFSNKSNRGLYASLKRILDMVDLVKSQQQSETEKNNIVVENPSESTDSADLNNQSTELSETSTNDKTGQTEQTQSMNDKQLTENDNNEGSVNVTISNDGKVNIDQNSKDKNAKLIPAKDGVNHELVIDPTKSNSNRDSTDLFDIEQGANFMDNTAKITKNPVVNVTKDGKYEIVAKGSIKRIDSPDQNNSPVEETNNPSPIDDAIQQKQAEVKEETKASPVAEQPITPTGERVSTTQKDDIIHSELNNSDKVDIAMRKDVVSMIKSAKTNKKALSMNEIIDTLKAKYANEITNSDEVKESLGRISRDKYYNKFIDINNKAVESIMDVDDFSNRYSSITEQTDEVKQEADKVVDALVKQFIKANNPVIKEVDGKKVYYFNFSNLMDYCNKVTESTTAARNLYGFLKDYFINKMNDKDFNYRIVDEDELINNNIINLSGEVINKTQEQLRTGVTQRVNIIDWIDTLTAQEDIESVSKIYKELDGLHAGDKLGIQVNERDISIISNGITIGRFGIPRVSKTNVDTFLAINDNWVYDINVGNNNSSKLKDFFKSIINEEDEDYRNLNNLIYKVTFDRKSLNKTEYKKLIKEIANNKHIKEAISNGFIHEEFNINYDNVESAVIGLSKLWKYVNKQYNRTNKESVQDLLSDSIDDWFDKLANSYKTVSELTSNPGNYDVVVNKVSGGRLVKINDNIDGNYDADKARKDALPVQKALTKENAEQVTLGFVSPNSAMSGTVTTSDGKLITFPGNVGSTFGIIYNTSGEAELIHAYPININDKNVHKDIIEIRDTIISTFESLLENFANNIPNSGQALEEFCSKLFNNGKNNNALKGFLDRSHLFNYLVNNGNRVGFSIARVGGESINIYYDSYGKRAYNAVINPVDKTARPKITKASVIKEELLKTFKDFIKTSSIDINFDGINNDINHTHVIGSFYSRDNKTGEFVVTIPKADGTSLVKRYNSYRDFMVNNNLIRLNTKVVKDVTGKDTNFIRYDGEHAIGNQNLYVDIKNKNSSSEQSTAKAETTKADEIETSVKDILSKKSPTLYKGNEILKLLYGNDEGVNNLLKRIKGFSLLPKNIIFDDTFNSKKGNENINAQYDGKTNIVTVGTKWMEMLKDPNTRSQAIRKLIHEQLHHILRQGNNRDNISKLREVFNEFKRANAEDGVDSSISQYEFKGYSDEVALEEFLVESLTSRQLIDRLNSINSINVNTNTKLSLFQKILKTLSDIFGWGIKEGSLYEKEFIALGDAMSNTQENNVTESVKEEQDVGHNDTSPTIDLNLDDMMDLMNSNVTEQQGLHPTINSFVNQLPLSTRIQMNEMIDNGNINISCR